MNYEDFVRTTDLSNHNLQFYLDGMNEENGEISGIWKRIRRGDYSDVARNAIDDHARGLRWVIQNFPDIRGDILKELGDRHWYTTRFLQEIDSDWNEIEQINQGKLIKREKGGKIMGHGDDREDLNDSVKQ